MTPRTYSKRSGISSQSASRASQRASRGALADHSSSSAPLGGSGMLGEQELAGRLEVGGGASASQGGSGGSGGSEVTTRARTSIVSALCGAEMPNSMTSVPK